MRKIILVGCENTKRTDFFLKAAKDMDIPVTFENILHCEPDKLENAIVKIDPFVYQESDITKMEGLLSQYTELLGRFAENKKITFLNHPIGIQEVLHKVRCKEILMESDIPTTKMLSDEINTLEELHRLMIKEREYAVFIKPVQSSGAVGIVAYRYVPSKDKGVIYTSACLENGKLINTKKLYRIDNKVQIKKILEQVLSMENIIERWYPKRDFNGKKYDLRVVWQFGKVDFIVVRQSKGPITNLHLNNQALSIEKLGLPEAKLNEIEELCGRAMAKLPLLNYAGIDIMFDRDNFKPRIIEINGQGDLIYQDIFQENIIYRNQLQYMESKLC